jgi:hypothetical protein
MRSPTSGAGSACHGGGELSAIRYNSQIPTLDYPSGTRAFLTTGSEVVHGAWEPHSGAVPAVTVPAARTEQPRLTQLPPQPTRLIDREEELQRLGTLLSGTRVRLLTLTGPGGVGKTRLLIAAAEMVQDQFPGGVWFVDLTPVVDPTLVVPTIARVMGVRELPGQDLSEDLAAFLSDRDVLLLLDNLEHLLAAVPALDALLAACPDLNLLVTSR